MCARIVLFYCRRRRRRPELAAVAEHHTHAAAALPPPVFESRNRCRRARVQQQLLAPTSDCLQYRWAADRAGRGRGGDDGPLPTGRRHRILPVGSTTAAAPTSDGRETRARRLISARKYKARVVVIFTHALCFSRSYYTTRYNILFLRCILSPRYDLNFFHATCPVGNEWYINL